LFFTVVCLVSSGRAFAADWDDCKQDNDQDLSIKACTKILGTGTRQDRDVAFYNRAVAHLKKDDYGNAIADFTETIRINPKEADAFNHRGTAYRGKDEDDRAIADFGEAIRLNPKYADAFNNRGLTYSSKGEYDAAIADFNAAIRIDPKYAEAYSNRGLAYNGKDDYDRAIADYDKAISLDPTSADAHNQRGMSYDDKREYDRAIADYNESLRLEPNSAEVINNRGVAHFNKGEYEKAIADYDEALKLKPGYSTAANNWRDAMKQMTAAAKPRETVAAAAAQAQGKRVALVIGNGAYKGVSPLANPAKDAKAVAAELTRLGFEVIDRYDLDHKSMLRTLRDFEEKASGADWALVYYAGHGMEMDGRNWLIPVDAEIAKSSDVGDEAIGLDRVLERVNPGKRLRIVILDACRNNPFLTRMSMTGGRTRSIARGLATIEPEHGEVVFFSARDGTTAEDGSGSNSPFTTALVKHLGEQGLEIGMFFRKVTSTVLASTNPKQEPFVYGRIPAESFYFAPPK
jgi:tetratricopeptide (TPR) repeat protein